MTITLSPHDFDTMIDRRNTGSIKWDLYGEGVLPLWVADMDFASPEPIVQALRARVDHGLFGYAFDDADLRGIVVERMSQRYSWDINPKDIAFLPNLVSALNVAARAYAEPGEGVLMQTPAYPPFLSAPKNGGREVVTADLALTYDGAIMRYDIDFDALEAAITPQTRLFLFCNPHNPVGRAWKRAELERLAYICLRHDLIICADEIHSDLLLDKVQHIPIASLSPEVAARTITLISPSKTFNMPTLGVAFAIAQNEDVLNRFKQAAEGIVPHPGALGITAAKAAYSNCQSWVDMLLPYLRDNRDFVVNYVQRRFPKVKITRPEATYLVWMDWREAGLPDAPFKFFLENAKVAFADGVQFGPAGEGFVRMNVASPRSMLQEALERMRAAVERL